MTVRREQVIDLRHWYHSQKGGGFYIACDGWNLAFMPDELFAVQEMWKEGRHIADIAEVVMRPVREVAVLVMSKVCFRSPVGREGGRVHEEHSGCCFYITIQKCISTTLHSKKGDD